MHSRTTFAFFVFVVAAAAHLFVAAWLARAVPALRRRRKAVLAAAFGLCAVTAVGRLGSSFLHNDTGVEFLAAGLAEWMIVILGAIPLAVATGATGLVHRLWPRREAAGTDTGTTPSTSPGPLRTGRREVLEGLVGAAAFGASTSVLGWGMVRGRHAFALEEVPVRIPGLPKALDGYTIAQVSDVHAGIFVGERELSEGFALVRAIQPDLVVATGDLVDYDGRYAAWLGRALADLPARDGVFAVLGNHDYYAGSSAVRDAMAQAGVRLLLNEGTRIRAKDGGGFALLGVDDLWAQRWRGTGPDLDRALAQVPPDAPRILLAHQPVYFDRAAGRVALQLSGHTHGGQINPGFRPGEFFMRYLAGRYERQGSALWVNRGFGVAGPPSRVGAPPEVTKIVLVSA